MPPPDLAPDAFRRHAHDVADRAADYLERLDAHPVRSPLAPGAFRAALPAAPPDRGEPMEAILADVERLVVPGLTHWNHPAFFGYFTSSSSGPGLLGEWLAAAFNANAMVWQASPAATELEEVVLDWLRQLLRLPPAFRGVSYEGGSASTLHGLAAAREAAAGRLGVDLRRSGVAAFPGPLRLYATSHTHSSVDKAVVALGLGTESVRRVPTDGAGGMDAAALAHAVAEDRAGGAVPFAVVATIGTTSSTAVDPVAAVADVASREGVWLHVDAAHGGALALLPEQHPLFAGWERADSVVVNPHKWLFVPLDLSVLYTRHPDVLRRAFTLMPDYLQTPHDEAVTNYMDYGLPLGRRFRALKLWFVLRYYGREGLAAHLRAHLALAHTFSGWIDAHPHFERMAPVPMSTVCFRARPPGVAEGTLDDLNARLLEAVNRSGAAFLTHTRLGGRYTLRLVVSGLRVEARHVEQAWTALQEALDALLRADAPSPASS